MTSLRFSARLVRALFLLTLGFSTACGGRSGEPLSEVCRDEGCVCTAATDCGLGLDCLDGICRTPSSVIGLSGFGEVCAEDADCDSGLCVAAGDGSYGRCSQSCTGECPEGWRCTGDVLGAGRCVQDVLRSCLPCTEDLECEPAGGSLCVTENGSGVCRTDCSLADCPSGHTCEEVELGGRIRMQCVPSSGSCETCAAGFARACARSNGLGTCLGAQTCSGGAFGSCDAPEAVAETCNGVDDDCDGLFDVEDPDLLPLEVDGFPDCAIGEAENCQGTWTCTVAAGLSDWACLPAAPLVESCNGLDDDCDGAVDESFVDAEGRYLSVAHCGGCNFDCRDAVQGLAVDASGAIVEGAVACELVNGAPSCVPKLCVAGQAPGPEGQPAACVEVDDFQCLECARDADCVWSANTCGQPRADETQACFQGCGTDAPYPGCTGTLGQQGCCPTGSTCTEVGGAPVCVPDGGSCGCNADRVGATRPCLFAGGNASCVGEQVCEASGASFAWSACGAEGVTLEVCNGLDDDCDGAIDETFVDTKGTGTYDTDAHCGQCYESCLVLPHAVGTCGGNLSCEIASCTDDPTHGKGLCRIDAECPPDFECDPDTFQCERECSSNVDCGGDVCMEGRCTSACTTDSECSQAFGANSVCIDGGCGRRHDWADADTEVANGCECARSADGSDAPETWETFPEAGLPYVDRNCDRVDGVAARALFVSVGAGGTGTQTAPFSTLSEAIAAFDAARHDHILVAEGRYEEVVRLRAGVQIHGGYGSSFTARDIAARPTVIAPSGPSSSSDRAAVVAQGLGSTETVLAGLTVRGWDATGTTSAGTGASTVGLWVQDSPGLRVLDVRIEAGDAADGAAGASGVQGTDGQDGAVGRDAAECSSTRCTGESQDGGAGGRNSACTMAAGNDGGGASGSVEDQEFQPPLGLDGRGGSNARYTSAGSASFADFCKYDCQVPNRLEGGDASAGSSGSVGSGGRGCASDVGSIDGDGWRPGSSASAGGVGSSGQGGGGGGAGGGVINLNPASCTIGRRVGDLGATGGGGGAGGCGGRAGEAGRQGGASIGLLLISGAAPTLEGVVIVPGAGGAGGRGGDGARGGRGGQGGLGGLSYPPAWCGGSAGRGGRGGDGGSGGGGGGGCGGPSFGIAGSGLGAVPGVVFSTVGRGGGAGVGGRSPDGANGGDGTDGRFERVWGF